MNIHEHQAKQILKAFGVGTTEGKPAFSVDEAVAAAKELNCPMVAVKAQIHAGGRGKAGGVKLAKSIEEVEQYAKDLLGKTLYTHQTGPEGKVVHRLWIEKASNIKKEYYLSLALDSQTAKVVLIASAEGGMDIEEVAVKHPEKIIKEVIDPEIGLRDYQVLNVADKIKLPAQYSKQFIKFLSGLYCLFLEKDCSIVEINPMVETQDGKIIALDAKINFDDSALYRHPDIQELRDLSEENVLETRASNSDLSYVSLDGNIGCLVIGAGLAMATMDAIKYAGAEPANFLDCGGSTTVEKAREALSIILAEEKVKGILVNIFGGISRCDIIATGIVAAVREHNLKLPLVVRLEGTNGELGNKILRESGLPIEFANSLTEGAHKIIELVKKNKEVA